MTAYLANDNAELKEQIVQARRQGWEQGKNEAILRCEAQERNKSQMSAAFYVAAMTYKEPTDETL